MDEYYYDEDIYEPTAADEILTEASTKLMDAIKQNVAARIKKIESDNERLEADNERLRARETAVNQEKRELAEQRKAFERKAARMSVEDFLGQRAVIMYKAEHRYDRGPKCNLCNDKRHRPYTTPLGKDAAEKCPCDVMEKVAIPKEFVLSEMRKGGRRGRGRVYMWFKKYDRDDDDGYTSSDSVKDENVYDGRDFASLERYKTYFRDESKCQEYCDWLNNQKEAHGEL